MKKIILILIVSIAVLALISCNKENYGSSSFLPGTSWETETGLAADFDKTCLTFTGAAGTGAATYNVTSEVSGTATFFNINNLVYNGKTYTTGAAYPSYQKLVIFEKGGLSELNFVQK